MVQCDQFFLHTLSGTLTRQASESLNVWTHLLGSALFFVLMITSLSTWLAEGETIDRTVFLIFVLSAQILLFLSSFFHLFYCMSSCPSEYSWFARLDYIGIAVLVCMFCGKVEMMTCTDRGSVVGSGIILFSSVLYFFL